MSDFPLYHKINSIQKRHTGGPLKGQFTGEWARPEFAYLEHNNWIWREKIDGTNIRIQLWLDERGQIVVMFGGRSDNAQIPKPLLQRLTELFFTNQVHLNLDGCFDEDTLRSGVTLFGEGFGAGIQKGGAYGPVDFILFDVKIGNFWLLEDAVTDIAEKLSIKRVPLRGYGKLSDAIYLVKNNHLVSAWAGVEIEGLVVVPEIPLFDRQGHRVITKIKGVDFK